MTTRGKPFVAVYGSYIVIILGLCRVKQSHIGLYRIFIVLYTGIDRL